MCRQAGSSPTIISSRSSKGSDYAEVPHGGWPENKVLANAMRHNPGYGIMSEFVGFGGDISVFGAERAPLGKLDVVSARREECTVAAMTDVRRDRRKEGLDGRCLHGGRRRCFRERTGIEMRRQAFDLRGVEDAVGPHEPDGFRRLLASRLINVGLARAVEIDARLGRLTFAHLPAQFLSLTIGHPVARSISEAVGDRPKIEAIDPGVGQSASTQRRATRPGLFPGPPPGQCAGLDPCNDEIGNFLRDIALWSAAHRRFPSWKKKARPLE